MKQYFIATLIHRKKYKLYATYNKQSDVLVVTSIDRISGAFGGFDKTQLIEEIEIAKNNGCIVMIETRNKKYQKSAPIIDMSARGNENRLNQDIAFEHFKSMTDSQELDVGNSLLTKVSTFKKQTRQIIDEKTGRISYKFKTFENELQPILVLIYAHIHPPMGVDYFITVQKAIMNQKPNIDRIAKKKHAVTVGYDEVLRKGVRAQIEAQQEINRQKAIAKAKNKGA
jgi:hypothetical protein